MEAHDELSKMVDARSAGAPLSYSGASSDTPETMPEIAREITLARGAFAALEVRTKELLEKIEPILRPTVPEPEGGVTRIADEFPTNTVVGQELRALQRSISSLEDRVANHLFRVEV